MYKENDVGDKILKELLEKLWNFHLRFSRSQQNIYPGGFIYL